MNGCGTAPGSAGGTEAPWAEEAAWVGATLEKPDGHAVAVLVGEYDLVQGDRLDAVVARQLRAAGGVNLVPAREQNVAVILPPAP